MRLGADTVRVVYRRSREEMPARAEELHHAEEEGIEFVLLTNPTQFFGNENEGLQAWNALRWSWESLMLRQEKACSHPRIRI